MKKAVQKVIAPALAVAMAASCTVCVNAEENETIKLTVWGAEEDQNLLKELTDKFQETYKDQTFDIQIGVESESTAEQNHFRPEFQLEFHKITHIMNHKIQHVNGQ